MIQNIQKESEEKMNKSVDSLKNNLTKIRTGRAHPSILDNIRVNHYGNESPLSQVSSIKTEDARTLLMVVWEKDMVSAIEKAIINSDLGLNPAVAGTNIRIPMPPLTEERRMDFIKLVKSEAEQTKVAIRNIRRDANSKIKEMLKKKTQIFLGSKRQLGRRLHRTTSWTSASAVTPKRITKRKT